jgi:phage tail sheath protein FI
MDNQQPGVIVTEKNITSPSYDVSSAVPLFIGYTEKGNSYTLYPVDDFSEYEALFGGPMKQKVIGNNTSVLYYSLKHYFDNGGSGGFVLSLGSYTEAETSSPEEVLATFRDSRIAIAVAGQPRITLVAIPDMVLLPDGSVFLWQNAWQTLLDLCQCRTGLFGLLETPDRPDKVIECLASFMGIGREWGAAYWPRLVTSYDQEGHPVVVPPSAALAAVIEYVDNSAGVWTAPANIDLAKVIKPTQSYLWVNDHLVNGDASFNLIRSFPGRGTRVWGCRTLSTGADSPLRYVQTRRLLSYIETNTSQLVRMFVFEPNSEITWYKVKGQVSNWLHKLWLQGGLYGTEESQAYSVKAGLDETMTEADVKQGIMIVNIRLATLYPAEFIELSLQFDMSTGGVLQ